MMLLSLQWGLASPALAVDWGNKYIPPAKDTPGDGMSDTREGGESYADAILIPSLPYSDTGATCDNRDDITPSCGYSTAPDVVYALTPSYDSYITIDLCGSGYDTIVEVQDGVGTPVACNDDYCEYQSGIDSVPLHAGHTYYIIVDGYRQNCGSYALHITPSPLPCIELCDPNEGEPECHDDYVDSYNGGCSSEPTVFQPIWGDGQGLAALCGESGTFLFNGFSFRDTDWFQIVGAGGTVTASLHAEFRPQLIFIYNADCGNLEYSYASGSCWDTLALEHTVESGAIAWIWVGPSVFNGVPCGTRYLLEVTGISGSPTSAEGPTWGDVKQLFR